MHFGGSMLAFYNNGNVIKVKAALRHRGVENTVKYIYAVENIKEEDFEENTSTTPEEVRKLGKAGRIKYDEMTVNGIQMHFYLSVKNLGFKRYAMSQKHLKPLNQNIPEK
jgi:hypothetical protein